MPLRIWINAFIPANVPGYTRTITQGSLAGKTAIPLPALADLNPVNLWKDLWNAFDTGYLTDQRSFSDSPTASVRMRSWMELDLSPPRVYGVRGSGHESSGTTEVDLKLGRQLGFKYADMSNCSWTFPSPALAQTFVPLPLPPPTSSPSPGPPPPQPLMLGSVGFGDPFNVKLVGQASDPLVSAAADIDYEGEFVIRVGQAPGTASVEFNGKIDSFPAFEAYASLDGKTKTLFQVPPPPGNTVTSLPGRANRPQSGSITFP